MQPSSRNFVSFANAVLLGLTSVAIAHGYGGTSEMGMPEISVSRPTLTSAGNATEPSSYWQYGEQSSLLVAHIAIMTLAWIFVLPIGVMLSISRSRYSLLTQSAFLAINAVGLVLAIVYNASTPDLYPNNAHHEIGWISTWVLSAQLLMGVFSAYAGNKHVEHGAFLPVSTDAIEALRRQSIGTPQKFRFSNDSGQGTERNTESLRSQSISSDVQREHADEDELEEKHGLLHASKVDKFPTRKIPALLSSKTLRVFKFFYNVIDRTILILGFIALTTGIVTYGGFFMGREIFSGLAHWIKGGVFFWYGILTIGRWAGCFADIGWSWNIKPSNTRAPTAEFVESFLIFFYGSTNIFLEHLNAWGQAWSSQDLEHFSITIMFIGGGLCGMLIESNIIRDLLNTRRQSLPSFPKIEIEEPKSYETSMNPIPALIVLLLGLMMSSHHQESMVSTMIHKQWGTLLVGAAFARAATYILLYLSPPNSVLPGRPPTELITSFCLMAGGIIFMASARDTVATMESNELDAMFVFTVSMGVITFLMAWIILVVAVKGWAVRKENRMA